MITKTFAIQEMFLVVARTQLNVREEKSNWSPAIAAYLAEVNINFAAPWCMAFVQWCVKHACKEFGIPDLLIDSGGVLDTWNKIDPKLKLNHTDLPQPGDIGIMDFGAGKGHTFFVESLQADNLHVNTLEGNSNDDGSRDGYEVCRKPNGRLISSVKGFIRLQ